MNEFEVTKIPEDVLKDVIADAFTSDSLRRRRQSQRALARVLDLAEQRGYKNETEFTDYFSDPQRYQIKTTRRLLRNLYEFVSEDEVVQLLRIHLHLEL